MKQPDIAFKLYFEEIGGKSGRQMQRLRRRYLVLKRLRLTS